MKPLAITLLLVLIPLPVLAAETHDEAENRPSPLPSRGSAR